MGVVIAVATVLVGACIGCGLATLILALRNQDDYDIWDDDTW